MREVERSAASVDEAVQAALSELGAGPGDVDVNVLEDSEAGARVRVTTRTDPEPPDAVEGGTEQPSTSGSDPVDQASSDDGEAGHGGEDDEWLDDQADLVADFLDDLFDAMDLPAEVEPLYEDGTMYVDVWAEEGGEGLGLLIGRHGAALDALQEIVRTVVHHRTGERCQVVVDVEDYRKRRRAQIVSRAQQAARRVQKSGDPERLDPMNAFERKIVHDAVGEIDGVATASEGEDPDRRVVIRRDRPRTSLPRPAGG
jgi:spoIIIJ-associated protein